MQITIPTQEQHCNNLNNNLITFNDHLNILLYVQVFIAGLMFISYLYLIWKTTKNTNT